MFRDELPFPDYAGHGSREAAGGGGGLFDAQPPEMFRPREPQPADLQLNMLQQLIEDDQAVVEEVDAPAEQPPAEIELPPDALPVARSEEDHDGDDMQSGDEDNDAMEDGSGSPSSSQNSAAAVQPNNPPVPEQAVFQQMLNAMNPGGALPPIPPPPQPPQPVNQPAGDQALLSSFFGSLNQPPAPQQPPQP